MDKNEQIGMVQAESENWLKRTTSEYDMNSAELIGLLFHAIMWCYDRACEAEEEDGV